MGKSSRHTQYTILVVTWMAAVLMCACNPNRSNTPSSRNYTAFITRYNVYYNGDKHFTETLSDMESNYEDDYTHLLFTHPVEAKRHPEAPQPSGNFDRSIEKAQKAIETRSIKKKPKGKPGHRRDPEYQEWMKRGEYNPFIHNAWLMLGRSQYYNGDFAGALSTFNYIHKNFSWLPVVQAEARLWQALCHISMDEVIEGEIILARVKPEMISNDELQLMHDIAWTNAHIKLKEYSSAIPYLRQASRLSKGAQRIRLTFLLGQISHLAGDNATAYEAFKFVADAASASYRTKFNARIRLSEVFSGGDIAAEINALNRMAKYDKNKNYLDQIYYAIGNLYRAQGKDDEAISSYAKAIKKSQRRGYEKAEAELALANLLFDRQDYLGAQPLYKSALMTLPESYSGYASLKHRSEILDSAAIPLRIVHTQDSLLRLALMPERQRNAIIDSAITAYKKHQRDAADEENQNPVDTPEQLIDEHAVDFSKSTSDAWYFYNPQIRESGRQEFARRWGNRKNEDDWRRSDKSASLFSTNQQYEEPADSIEGTNIPEAEAPNPKQERKAKDPRNREYYLAGIPFSQEARQKCNEKIHDALYIAGNIINNKFDDPKAVTKAYDRLLTDFPNSPYRPETLYNMYLMLIRHGEIAEAEKYSASIRSEYPYSEYARSIAAGKAAGPQSIEQAEVLYRKAYAAYLANENATVHEARAKAEREYPSSAILPKFMFIDALAYVTDGQPEKFSETARSIAEKYPHADVGDIAEAWVEGLNQGKEPQRTSANIRPLYIDTYTPPVIPIQEQNDSILPEYDENAPHMLLLAFHANATNANAMLYDVARFNFGTFMVKDFDLETLKIGNVGIIVVSGFKNKKEVDHYLNAIEHSTTFSLPADVRLLTIPETEYDGILRRGISLDDDKN